MEMNIVHGVHDGLTFWRWWNKFQEADGVASGEKQQQNRGDAVEPGGFHGWDLISCSVKFFLNDQFEDTNMHWTTLGVKKFRLNRKIKGVQGSGAPKGTIS